MSVLCVYNVCGVYMSVLGVSYLQSSYHLVKFTVFNSKSVIYVNRGDSKRFFLVGGGPTDQP